MKVEGFYDLLTKNRIYILLSPLCQERDDYCGGKLSRCRKGSNLKPNIMLLRLPLVPFRSPTTASVQMRTLKYWPHLASLIHPLNLAPEPVRRLRVPKTIGDMIGIVI